MQQAKFKIMLKVVIIPAAIGLAAGAAAAATTGADPTPVHAAEIGAEQAPNERGRALARQVSAERAQGFELVMYRDQPAHRRIVDIGRGPAGTTPLYSPTGIVVGFEVPGVGVIPSDRKAELDAASGIDEARVIAVGERRVAEMAAEVEKVRLAAEQRMRDRGVKNPKCTIDETLAVVCS